MIFGIIGRVLVGLKYTKKGRQLQGQEYIIYLQYYVDPIYQPLRSGRIWHKDNFKAEFDGFEFRVFLFLDLLPHQGWRTQSVLLFTHSWRENHWIHTFPKGISSMWNAISLVQDLNSSRRIHFLRR